MVLREAETGKAEIVDPETSGFVCEGVKGSFVMSGKETSRLVASAFRNSTDFINTTWQFSD